MILSLAFLLAIGITPIAAAQANPPAVPLRYGTPTLWESSDGLGGAFGIEISSLGASTEYTIGVYHRGGPSVQCGEENFFVTGPRYDNVAILNSNNLQVDFKPNHHADPSDRDIHLHLTFDSASNTWNGDFHRGDFNSDINLLPTTRKSNHGGCIINGR